MVFILFFPIHMINEEADPASELGKRLGETRDALRVFKHELDNVLGHLETWICVAKQNPPSHCYQGGISPD
jgi:hypothetical protein